MATVCLIHQWRGLWIGCKNGLKFYNQKVFVGIITN
jgi:hypothetical protein